MMSLLMQPMTLLFRGWISLSYTLQKPMNNNHLDAVHLKWPVFRRWRRSFTSVSPPLCTSQKQVLFSYVELKNIAHRNAKRSISFPKRSRTFWPLAKPASRNFSRFNFLLTDDTSGKIVWELLKKAYRWSTQWWAQFWTSWQPFADSSYHHLRDSLLYS